MLWVAAILALSSLTIADNSASLPRPFYANITLGQNEEKVGVFQDDEEEPAKFNATASYYKKKVNTIKCAVYKKQLKWNQCLCIDQFNLCPKKCDEQGIASFCSTQADPDQCPSPKGSCSLSCKKYVNTCCPCIEAKIANLDASMLPIDDEDGISCTGKFAFNEHIPALISGTPNVRLCEFYNLLARPPQCAKVLPQCIESYTGKSVWLALGQAYAGMLKFNTGGLIVRIGCKGYHEALFLWKAMPTVITVCDAIDSCTYNVTVDSGFPWNNCGRVSDVCHDTACHKLYAMPQGSELHKKEYDYGKIYYRRVIKDCSGWFISSKYSDKYNVPDLCNQQWFKYNPHPVTKKVGMIGNAASPSFTNIEWVGIHISFEADCEKKDFEEYVDVTGTEIYGVTPPKQCYNEKKPLSVKHIVIYPIELEPNAPSVSVAPSVSFEPSMAP